MSKTVLRTVVFTLVVIFIITASTVYNAFAQDAPSFTAYSTGLCVNVDIHLDNNTGENIYVSWRFDGTDTWSASFLVNTNKWHNITYNAIYNEVDIHFRAIGENTGNEYYATAFGPHCKAQWPKPVPPVPPVPPTENPAPEVTAEPYTVPTQTKQPQQSPAIEQPVVTDGRCFLHNATPVVIYPQGDGYALWGVAVDTNNQYAGVYWVGHATVPTTPPEDSPKLFFEADGIYGAIELWMLPTGETQLHTIDLPPYNGRTYDNIFVCHQSERVIVGGN